MRYRVLWDWGNPDLEIIYETDSFVAAVEFVEREQRIDKQCGTDGINYFIQDTDDGYIWS